MAEAGGPIYEGVGRPEVQKKGIVDKLKEKWKNAVAKDAAKQEEYKKKREEWKKLGPNLEQKHLEAFDKITNALDEGKLKQVAEKMRWAAKANAKLARVSLAAVDMTVGMIPLIAGSLLRGRGIVALVDDFTGARPVRARAVITAIGLGGAGAALGAGVMWYSPARRAGTWMAEQAGNVGERVAKWTNKILTKNPKAEVAPA